MFGDEPPPLLPVPAFIVVGADDTTVPPGGGPLQLRALLGRRPAADRNVAPAMAQATYWARHNGCREPVRTETRVSHSSAWIDCSSGAPVVFHSVSGNGHAWPGGEAGRGGAGRRRRPRPSTRPKKCGRSSPDTGVARWIAERARGSPW